MSTILVLCPYVPHPPTHGGSIRSRVLLQALAADHRVHVAAAIATDADRANAQALGRELGVAVTALPAHAAPRASLPRKLRCWLAGDSELLQRRWRPEARASMPRLLRDVEPELVVFDSTFALPLWDGRSGGFLLHLHNLEHAMFARADGQRRGFTDRWTRRLEARAIREVERRALGLARATVTVSDDDRRLALGLQPAARVDVVPNSIDLERLPLLPPPPPAAPGPVRLLYVGGLDYPPNLEAVTELVERHLPALRAAFPGLVVRLVGRDPAGHAARWRGTPGIEAPGAVDDLRPHYAASHAVYLPIRSGGGTRIKILEAWALGRPVLTTAVGCEGLPAEDGVHLRCFANAAQGTAALRDVLAGQGEALCRAGRELVERRFAHPAAIAALRAIAAAAVRSSAPN